MKYFDNKYWAFFNCRGYDIKMGRLHVREKYGNEGWEKVSKIIWGGIMKIFDVPPTPETELFVKTVAEYSDKRAYRRNNKKVAKWSLRL